MKHSTGRLVARPGEPVHATEAPATGLQQLRLANDRDVLLYVPSGYTPEAAAPFALMLHGAGGTAESGMRLLEPLADDAGLILLAPSSREHTWDLLVGGYGTDVEVIDRALAETFERYAVDLRRVAVGGFSDGASYALSLGITNGDLFSDVIAFSPGFMAPGGQEGAPRIFISHGTRDQVLPIDRCSRRIVPRLERAGYGVEYHEFDGPHTVPPGLARRAVDRLLT